MSDFTGKGDLRTVRTNRAINDAMTSLLKRSNFKKITVLDICAEAQIGRPTFYTHFTDKYSLLRDWLMGIRPAGLTNFGSYEQAEEAVNLFLVKNKTVVKNLLSDADEETVDILAESVLSALGMGGKGGGAKNKAETVLSNFFAGGMTRYFLQQINNGLQPAKPVNKYLVTVILQFQKWMSEET